MYDGQTLLVRAHGSLASLPGELHDAVSQVLEEARANGLAFTPGREARGGIENARARDVPRAAADPSEALWDGHIVAHSDGSFTAITQGIHEPLEIPKSHRLELRALLELRDSTRRLLGAEAASAEDTEQIGELRTLLRSRYGAYAARYGPINRFTLRRTGHRDPDTGEERMARVTPPAIRIFRSDPFAALVTALEIFDDASHIATPAGILAERVVSPRSPRLGADSPQDALAICLDTHGRVDLEQIARLLGVEPSDARAQLGELVYHDPEHCALVPAAEYLSGNVRRNSSTPGGQPSRTPHSTSTSKPSSGCCRASSPPRRSSRGSGPRGSTATPTAGSSPSCSRTHRSTSSTPEARSGRSRATTTR